MEKLPWRVLATSSPYAPVQAKVIYQYIDPARKPGLHPPVKVTVAKLLQTKQLQLPFWNLEFSGIWLKLQQGHTVNWRLLTAY